MITSFFIVNFDIRKVLINNLFHSSYLIYASFNAEFISVLTIKIQIFFTEDQISIIRLQN